MTDTEASRIDERLDKLFAQSAHLTNGVTKLTAQCEQFGKLVESHEETIHGNGKDGLLVDVATLKSGRTDTLSVKSVIALVGSISAMAAGIGAAMAAFAP